MNSILNYRAGFSIYFQGFVRKIYMNDDLHWSIEGDEEVNLRSALVHQIGHALGIGHKSFESIMSPIYKESDENVSLSLMENDPASADFDVCIINMNISVS